MISSCKHCQRRIRDCTALQRNALAHEVALGWYHTDDGHERCPGGMTMAAPVPLVSVSCPAHQRRPERDCITCETAAQVMVVFHEKDRCIPACCVWLHVQND